MKSAIGSAAMQKGWKRCLVGLCSSGLLACGGSGSESATPKNNVLAATMSAVTPGAAVPDGSADLTSASAAAANGHPTTYSVVNLGSSNLLEIPVINSSNQIAFSTRGESGARAEFFDGETVSDIGAPGVAEVYAAAMNDAGQVAGYSIGAGGTQAFRWTKTGGMLHLGKLPNAATSKGRAINKQGQVVGYSDSAYQPPPNLAFIWGDTTGMVDLGRLGTSSISWSIGQVVNDAGMAAGYSIAPDGDAHAFAWTPGGGMVDLGKLGNFDSRASLINNAGQIAGHSLVSDANGYNYHTFVWNKATGMVDIGTLYGLRTIGFAMNSAGEIVGFSDQTEFDQRAFFWSKAGGLANLGTLGGTISVATGINKNGVVVGYSTTRPGQFDSRAFLWTKAKGMVDLNTRIQRAPAGLVLISAAAISDTGGIIANSNAGLVLLKPGARGTDAPVVGPITPSDPIAARTRVAFSASFTDQNRRDTHKATWSWGDRCAASPGTITESHGVGTAREYHTYCTAGVYPVTLTVTDNTGRTATVTRDVVVYDPSAAAVAGDGWFMSPPGAYTNDKVQSGRATFSFVSKVTNDPTRRQGEMTLRFHAANLNFQSAAYDSLSIAGTRAQYQGSGTVNGNGNYRFLMTAVDGSASNAVGQGRIRMKIWHIDALTKAEVVDYDNQVQTSALAGDSEGSVIGGGSIMIRR